MSTRTTARDAGTAASDNPPEDRRVLPTIKGYERAEAFLNGRAGIKVVTARAIQTHTQRGTLKSFTISNARWFSETDLMDWVMSLREGGASA
ncbi:MAG: hypothetical protein WBD41_00490 [Rhodococcus sp. (in: high G+C Gram-positive bacteria)]|jgi:hypothetical protein|uniref:hypothetical protein n=1 Tax=Rhodococcus sp. EPR-157 TaxID=1813677 RepID=UPI0007BB2FFE|nr:hypothetical protein [Rhodococcus sp. EPR-157]KZE98909.1 hypothetical protein A2J03_13120 [Rhodococcus sp. EPR-157]